MGFVICQGGLTLCILFVIVGDNEGDLRRIEEIKGLKGTLQGKSHTHPCYLGF
jgi:hypothetical protein